LRFVTLSEVEGSDFGCRLPTGQAGISDCYFDVDIVLSVKFKR
jgi:hypothetical protein